VNKAVRAADALGRALISSATVVRRVGWRLRGPAQGLPSTPGLNALRATPFYGTEPRDLARGEAALVDEILAKRAAHTPRAG
jgi:hypothetical protein